MDESSTESTRLEETKRILHPLRRFTWIGVSFSVGAAIGAINGACVWRLTDIDYCDLPAASKGIPYALHALFFGACYSSLPAGMWLVVCVGIFRLIHGVTIHVISRFRKPLLANHVQARSYLVGFLILVIAAQLQVWRLPSLWEEFQSYQTNKESYLYEKAISLTIPYGGGSNGPRDVHLQQIALCTEVVNLNPNHENAYAYRGLVEEGLGMFEQAIADFRLQMRVPKPLYSQEENIQRCEKKLLTVHKAIAEARLQAASRLGLSRDTSTNIEKTLDYFSGNSESKAILQYELALAYEHEGLPEMVRLHRSKGDELIRSAVLPTLPIRH